LRKEEVLEDAFMCEKKRPEEGGREGGRKVDSH
jgi:hypothetical protein